MQRYIPNANNRTPGPVASNGGHARAVGGNYASPASITGGPSRNSAGLPFRQTVDLQPAWNNAPYIDRTWMEHISGALHDGTMFETQALLANGPYRFLWRLRQSLDPRAPAGQQKQLAFPVQGQESDWWEQVALCQGETPRLKVERLRNFIEKSQNHKASHACH